MGRTRLATAWLSGCSGCHMSVLDLDEKLIELASAIEIVYGPLVDAKEYPENVGVALVEGAIGATEHQELLMKIRRNTKTLVALGDCAVTGNVPSMRNYVGKEAVLNRAYLELASYQPQIPGEVVTPLVKTVQPLHKGVLVDVFVPGCPPSAESICCVLTELLAGRMPKLAGAQLRFGSGTGSLVVMQPPDEGQGWYVGARAGCGRPLPDADRRGSCAGRGSGHGRLASARCAPGHARP